MKKETQNIATNTSSGAEKVEKIEKKIKQKSASGNKNAHTVATKIKSQTAAKGDAALGDSKKSVKEIDVKKQNAQSTIGKAEAESAAAKARVEAALKRKELKEKRKAERVEKKKAKKEARQRQLAERKAESEKKKQAKRALIAKRAEEKKALAEKRAAARKAKADARREKRNKTTHKRKNEGRKRERRENQGYGGWIAAVVALGVTTLALATTATVGAIESKRATDAMMTSYRSTMYEMTGILENVEKDLDRVRVSDSSAQQSRILTDLLVQARLAEADMEKMPIAAERDRNITAFVNRTAATCERILSKLNRGEKLSEEDRAVLDGLYQINHGLKEEVASLMEKMTDDDFMEFVKKGKGMFADALGAMEKMTLAENNVTMDKGKMLPPMDGEQMPKPKTLEEKPVVEAIKAEELCAQYFTAYNIQEYQCVGETVTKDYAAYNVQGYDDKGLLLFAEIDQKSGKLIRFDYYEECAGDTFDLKNAERIAEEFLDALGYDDLEIVRCRQNGTTTDFTFVYEDDGVAYYPDEVRVKVCRSRGVVSGMDASKYLQNHKDRGELNVKITLAQAYEKVYKELSVDASRLTVIKTARGEKAAYEMLCSYKEDKYLIYLDAATGEELSIVNVNTIQ